MPKKKAPSNEFSREAVRQFNARERQTITDIVCPDMAGDLCEMKFRVQEPVASDLLRLMTASEVYGEVGPSVALIAACVVDRKGVPIFVNLDDAVNFLQGNKDGIGPLLDAIKEVVGDSVEIFDGEEGDEDDSDPLD